MKTILKIAHTFFKGKNILARGWWVMNILEIYVPRVKSNMDMDIGFRRKPVELSTNNYYY